MARSFKELGRESTELIEQGKELETRVQQCKMQIQSAAASVASARQNFEQASQVDEEGNAVGDVSEANARLAVAQNQLAASQRALQRAQQAVEENNQRKRLQVQRIEQHNKTSRANISRLAALSELSFSENADEVQQGLIERYNEIEQARVALLESMGEKASVESIQVPAIGSTSSRWTGAGYGALDLSGEPQSYQESRSQASASSLQGQQGSNSPPVNSTSFSGDDNIKSGDLQNSHQDTESEKEFKKSLFGRNPSSKNSSNVYHEVKTIDFNGLTIENNGMAADKYFVRGNNYTKFSHFWSNYGSYSRTDANYITTVNPNNIEGIFLNENEAKDPYLFWNRNRSYQIDSESYFSSLACHIPEIQSRISSGESVESIKNSPELGSCFYSYFETPISVYKVDDYYYFAGSGRHRCMAAQKLGINIPVKVIGEYKSNIKVLNEVTDFPSLSVYMGTKHGVSLSDSIGSLELNTVLDTISGLESVSNEYPDVSEFLKEGITSDIGVMSCTGSKLSFNPEYFKNGNNLRSTCSEMSEQGFWIKNASPESIGVHEAAHGVEWALIQANAQYISESDKIKAWNNCSEASKIVRNACANIQNTDYGRAKSSTDLVKSISKYALQNDSETMAEAFADVYANGENAKPLSKEIKRLTQILMKKYKGGV